MSFVLGRRSRLALEGVHPKLVAVVERAILICDADFSVHEGVRSKERQAAYLKRGVTRTMNSKHLVQPDGYGHAVDLVPYIDGQLRWEWPPIYSIAAAVRRAAIELDTELIWGGVWDRSISQLGATADAIARDVRAYCERHPGPDFIDGPHYQLAGGI